MVPEPSRREVLSALAAASVAGVAGCTGNTGGDAETTNPPTSAEPTTESTTASPDTTEEPTAEERSDGPTVNPAVSPVAAVDSAFGAEDAVAFQSRFHPLHPFSLEKLSREDAQNLLENSTTPSNVERLDREVTVDLVMAAPLPGSDVERAAVEDALSGADAAVVSATADGEEGSQTVQLATVEYDGGWLILAHPLSSGDETATSALDATVVSGVAFEPDQNAARVQFVSEVVADSVTVESVQADDSTSTSTPGSVSYLQVAVAPDGDEVVVSATRDGKSRVVHRERYPESDRLVNNVEFVANPEGDARDAIARVTFNDTDENGRVRVSSTVSGGESEAEPAGNLDYLNVGVDPDGDEVVVTYPVGGEAAEIHRERWHP